LTLLAAREQQRSLPYEDYYVIPLPLPPPLPVVLVDSSCSYSSSVRTRVRVPGSRFLLAEGSNVCLPVLVVVPFPPLLPVVQSVQEAAASVRLSFGTVVVLESQALQNRHTVGCSSANKQGLLFSLFAGCFRLGMELESVCRSSINCTGPLWSSKQTTETTNTRRRSDDLLAVQKTATCTARRDASLATPRIGAGRCSGGRAFPPRKMHSPFVRTAGEQHVRGASVVPKQ